MRSCFGSVQRLWQLYVMRGYFSGLSVLHFRRDDNRLHFLRGRILPQRHRMRVLRPFVLDLFDPDHLHGLPRGVYLIGRLLHLRPFLRQLLPKRYPMHLMHFNNLQRFLSMFRLSANLLPRPHQLHLRHLSSWLHHLRQHRSVHQLSLDPGGHQRKLSVRVLQG